MNRAILLLALMAALALVTLAACTSSKAGPTSSEGAIPSPTTPIPAQIPSLKPYTLFISPEGDMQAILGTTVLRPGPQRMAFLLVGPKAIINIPEATVKTFYPSDSAQPKETKTAHFSQWPYATKGSYTTNLSFDGPGKWRLDFEVDDHKGFNSKAQLLVEVNDGYGVVDIGSLAPASENKTLDNVSGLSQLSSAHMPDPDLYTTTIADALKSGRPTMAVFATPAFCTSPTCGPQVETVHELKERYKGRAHFIHVEVYDNPHEVQGDLRRARLSPVMVQWGLTTIPYWANESWVFVVDKDGRVSARFEAYAVASELEEALLRVLGEPNP